MQPETPKQPSTKPKRSKRKLWLALASCCLLALLAFPWWSSWIAKPILQSVDGVSVDSIQRVSWKKWRFEGLAFEQNGVSFAAAAGELLSPTRWLFNRIGSGPDGDSLSLANWSLSLKPSSDASETTAPIGPHAIFKQVESIQTLIFQHVSEIAATDGIVKAGDFELRIESLVTNPTNTSLELSLPAQEISASFELTTPKETPWSLTATSGNYQAEITLSESSEALELAGDLASEGNQGSLLAKWPADQTSFLPEVATFTAENFSLDDRYPFWQDAPPLSVDLTANWADEQYTFALQAQEVPSATNVPAVDLSGRGDLSRLSIESASIDLPWISAQNNAPLNFDFTLEDPLENASLVAQLDLSRLPWIETTGLLNAKISTITADSGLPRIVATLSGESIQLYDTVLSSIQANLSLLGKELTVASLELESKAGSKLIADGLIDLETRSFQQVEVETTLNNESQTLLGLLPPFEWQTINASASLNGPLSSPNISATLATEKLQVPQLQPLALSLSVEGNPQDLQAHLKAEAPDESLTLDLGVISNAEQFELTLSNLILSGNEKHPSLSLAQPSIIRIHKSDTDLTLSNFVLGQDGIRTLGLPSLALKADELSFALYASELNLDRANPWLFKPLPSLRVIELDTQANLTETNASFRSSGEAIWTIAQGNDIEASWRAQQSDETDNTLRISHLEIGSQGKHILRANGAFPLQLNWKSNQLASSVDYQAPIAFELHSSPHPDFWRSAEAFLPIAIRRPTIDAQLSGSLEKPTGALKLKLASLTWRDPQNTSRSLTFSDIATSLFADSRTLNVDTLSANVGSNQLQAKASLPLTDSTLIQLARAGQAPDLSNLTGQASLSINDLAPLQAWLPAFVREQGSATIEATIKPNDIVAVADLKNFATRPLPPLGSLSEVSGKVTFNNGVLQTSGLTGLAEQSLFTLSGSADFRSGENPLLDLAFASDAFPIVRDSGLLLSGDIDIKLVSTNSSQPSLSGEVLLTKGIMLVEPELLAGSTKTSYNRPPYFAVTQEPFQNWGLDIGIRGDEFLRVSNSFFEGNLSADFNLEGTLGAPLLIGRAIADSGRIFFPASSLQLLQGEALITRDRPTELQLEAVAQGRLFAYDINLTAEGAIEDPEITITTNPALTQVEALLLLTTGTVPSTQSNLAQQSATSLGLFIGKGLFRKLSGHSGNDSSSRLSLEVGQDISLQGKKTIEASYQISDTLEIEGEYDKRDEYNANLKWTIFEK